MQWIPLKEGSDLVWLTQNKSLKTSKTAHLSHGREAEQEEMLPHVIPGKSFVTIVTNLDTWLAHAQRHTFKGNNSSHHNTHLCHITIVKCNQGPAGLGEEKHNSNTITVPKSNEESYHRA